MINLCGKHTDKWIYIKSLKPSKNSEKIYYTHLHIFGHTQIIIFNIV